MKESGHLARNILGPLTVAALMACWLLATAGTVGAEVIREDVTVNVVAGDGIAGFRDGPSARFNKPIRLAPFTDDSVLVADINNTRFASWLWMVAWQHSPAVRKRATVMVLPDRLYSIPHTA